jgi:hypothetical protein
MTKRWMLLLLSALFSSLIAACDRPTAELPPKTEPQTPASAAKIFVVEEGLYQVTEADLEAAGLGWGDFDPTRLQLLYRGQEEPLWVQGQGDDLLLRFYGRASESRYARENVYGLRLGEGAGQRMEERTKAEGGELEGGAEGYVATVRAEENRLYSSRVAEGDHWFWESLPAPITQTFTVTLTALAPGAGRPSTRLRASLRVEVWGSTEGPPAPDHHLRLSFNGQPVADEMWDGQGRHLVEANLSPSLLAEGPNTVTLEAVGDTGVAADVTFLDWIEVRYPRRFVADEDRLTFESDGGLHRLIGFSGDAVVLDVTHPEKPALVASIEQEGEGTAVTLWVEPGHRYLAVGPAGFLSPTHIARAISNPNLRSPDNQADYVAIVHADLMEVLQPLLQWREEQGLKVIAVPVEAVYDQFNHGLPDPTAIRDLLRYGRDHWAKPAPRYVLLVGDASYDYRDYLKTPSKNLIPTSLVETHFVGETASDNWFVDLDDDTLPDMAIGRLPAKRAAEVEAVVDKIMSYERSPASGEWHRRVLFVADDDQPAFEATSDDLVESYLPPDYLVVKVYLSAFAAPEESEARIIEEINEGAAIVTYVGHAALDVWAKERMFSSQDIASLHNGAKSPFVVTMTCLDGYFHHPKLDCLAEDLLLAEGKGAVACFAPTSESLPSDQDALAKALFEALFADDAPTIGEAVMRAKRNLPQGGHGYEDLDETYTLFGDPALRLVGR